jgi:Fe-S cluster assembly protein SufD
MENTELKKFDVKQWYLSNFELFENRLDGSSKIPFHNIRKTAISRFSELGFPSTRHEEWKYTNVAPILAHKFNLVTEPVKLPRNMLTAFLFDGLSENLLVFVNGHFSKELSRFEPKPKGLIFDSLRNALRHRSEIIEKHLGHYAIFENETFTALNTAFTYDGALLYIPHGTIVEKPFHIINLSVSEDSGFVCHPRNLFIVEEGSQVKIIESYHHLADKTYFNNVVTEIFVDETAIVDHIKIQEESVASFHIANTQVHQGRNSVYTSVNIDLGGALVRNNLNVLLNAENCEAHLSGFYFGTGNQHVDNHTFMDHAKPHCFSNELYKGILGGRATGVFNGKIMVRPGAQKTNALQSNKTLLLSNEASINAKPQLEIFADDVKCTHGATIGQLDEEAIFYLRTRGISEEMGAAMLRYAFAADVFENIGIEPVQEKLDRKIIEILKKVQQG